jgi:hypothetical protein
MVLLNDIGQVEAHFRPFGDSPNLDARKVHSLRRMYHGYGNLFGTLDGTPRWHKSIRRSFQSIYR